MDWRWKGAVAVLNLYFPDKSLMDEELYELSYIFQIMAPFKGFLHWPELAMFALEAFVFRYIKSPAFTMTWKRSDSWALLLNLAFMVILYIG